MRHFTLYLLFLGITFNNFAQKTPYFQQGQDPNATKKEWVKVKSMSDEFNNKKLNLKKWHSKPLENGWVWDGRAPGLFRAENVVVKDGKMNVTVSKLDKPVKNRGKIYTHQGAIVRSLNSGKVGWYFETRMKANATVMSSTFWLMSRPDCEKKEELDIQECVGRLTEKTHKWAKNWDGIFHSNAIHRKTKCHPESERDQKMVYTPTKNHERFYVYGAWWKSKTEILCFLDGKHVYTLNPTVEWDTPGFIQMAIETYDWNPIPDDGGLVESGTWEQRTTKYDWVRTWKLK
ncbi:glycosyl hydrolase [Wenyingzhuangia sp. IMCC45574]